jgi:FkbM family methyltransferase
MQQELRRIFDEVACLPDNEATAILRLIQDYMSSSRQLKDITEKDSDYFTKMAAYSSFTTQLLGRHTKGLLTTTSAGLFITDPEDYAVGWRLRNEGSYGEDQLEMLYPLLSGQSRVLVVGGHIGTIAIPIARKGIPTVVIEANPHTFRLLEMNIRLNELTNCAAHNIAANDRDGPLPFYLNRSNSGGSKRVPLTDQHMYTYDSPETISVPGYPLDEYIRDHRFDLVIMDIEGSEYFALKGMPDILQQTTTLIMEFLPHHLRNVSGITVQELLSTLPEFDSLTIPTLDICVGYKDFHAILQHMYDNNRGDEAIIFEK